MSVIRSFVAIDLSPEILRQLEGVLKQLKDRLDDAPVRWVPVENIHVTLKFLGDVSVSNLEVLQKLIQAEVSRHSAFEIRVERLGAFPSMRRPRVIWVGVEAPPELSTIQRCIEDETARLGYAREEREFSPHLTLGRVSRSATSQDAHRISEGLAACNVGFLGAAHIQAVHLYRSDLRPGGAVYSRLFTAALK